MTDKSVRRIYSILQARWYNPFKRLWNVLASSRAETDLSTFLRENLDETKMILELACGTAMNLEKILSLNLNFKSYLGLDFSPDMLRIARRKFQSYPNIEFREMDITRLEDLKDKFDILVCTWVLSHLRSPSAFVNQAESLMTERGRFFLIFFSEPKWHLKFWIAPLAWRLLRSRCVRDEEVSKFKSVRKIRHYSSNMVTVIEIYRSSN